MYKYSREKINTFLENLLTHHINLKDNNWVKYSERLFDIRRDLLAQKEDRKECKHELGDKEEHDHLGTYHIAGDTCVKCGKHIMDWDNPTPSPLEGFEEIEEIEDYDGENMFNINPTKKAINKLIRNQKKLYQYIKEKKI